MTMIKISFFIVFICLIQACADSIEKPILILDKKTLKIDPLKETSIVIMGTVQDAGSPQIGCEKECCSGLSLASKSNRMVCSMGIIDPKKQAKYLIDATPDIVEQMDHLNSLSTSKNLLDGVFLTHAHIGHYTGLMYLGKEAINSNNIPVYCMPRMKSFLEENGPWSQLVENKNIKLKSIKNRVEISTVLKQY